MKASTALFLAALVWRPGAATAQSLTAGVDLRTELLGIVFRLAGNPEYNQCRVPRYARAIDTWFAPHRDHEVVRLARDLRTRRSVGFDAVMNFAIHLTNATDPVERVPFGQMAGSPDPRWRDEGVARSFLEALRSFVADARVAAFFESQQDLYDTAQARIGAVAEALDVPWFERFFGARPEARFRLVPGLCNGGASYGPRFRGQDGGEELYAVVGVPQADSAGWPRLGAGLAATIVHEFAHSFVNPVMARESDTLGRIAAPLFEAVAPQMRAQAYGHWAPVLNESVVRAAVVQYIRAHQGDAAAREELRSQEARGFLWIGELDTLLDSYQRDRGRYGSFTDFLPRLVSWVGNVAPRAPGMAAAYDSRRPRLLAVAPDTTLAVHPATSALELTFDRPMRTGYSLNLGPGGRAAFPEVLGQAWDSSHTRFTLTVRLEPGRLYDFLLNGPSQGFQSAEGVALAEHRIRFRTGGL